MQNETKTESKLKKFGKAAMGKLGMMTGMVGAAGVLGSAGAFVLAVAAPALLALVQGAPLLPLLARVAETLPYFGMLFGAAATVVAAGAGLAHAGGEKIFGTDAAQAAGETRSYMQEKLALMRGPVAPTFNKSSPRATVAAPDTDASLSINLAALAVTTLAVR